MKYEITSEDGLSEIISWEVFVDAWNQSYLYCQKSKSYAYFVNNGTLHYFTEFIGDRNSMLYHFYLAANKILLGYYDLLEVNDKLPITNFYSGISRFIQDFTAPFNIYLKAEYSSKFIFTDDDLSPKEIKIESKATIKASSIFLKELNYELIIHKNKIAQLITKTKQGTTIATCID
jgi:hypothetical protein